MRRILVTLTISLLVGTTLPAQPSGTQKPAGKAQAGHPAGASHALSANYANLQWQTMVPELGDDSPRISILRVDPRTGATQLLIRVPKQMHVPMHWHSANETHTIIRGTWVFEHETVRDQLGPGSFNYIPARMAHQAWASDDALVFITVDSAWDVTWVDGPPTKADLGKTPIGR
jgi:mannose-6-phosphate isomerase-like protein (cupin superfamily)